MGSTFTHLCRLSRTGHEVANLYFAASGVPVADRVPLSFAEAKYQKLLHWANSLESEMSRGQGNPNHVILFQ
jgi:hypothetical protein